MVTTAAAAVNAGTCLEDANLERNVFSHIGEAVRAVSFKSTYNKIIKHGVHWVLYAKHLDCMELMHAQRILDEAAIMTASPIILHWEVYELGIKDALVARSRKCLCHGLPLSKLVDNQTQ
jgi:hypothetical protein